MNKFFVGCVLAWVGLQFQAAHTRTTGTISPYDGMFAGIW